MIRPTPGPWADSAEPYSRSFGRLCGGTVPTVLDAVGPAGSADRLLDVGTGPGTVAAAAAKAGYRVVAVDSDQSMVDFTRRQHPAIPVVRAALPELPCPDRAFRAVTANFVVNHTVDPRRAVDELFRVTQRRGRVAATIWPAAVGPLNQLWNDVITLAEVESRSDVRLPPHLDFDRTTTGFAAVLRAAGFRQVSCRETSWTFRIHRDRLWLAVEAGIAVIGRTYVAQQAPGRARMRRAYLALTNERHPEGTLSLPVTALIAAGHRPRQLARQAC